MKSSNPKRNVPRGRDARGRNVPHTTTHTGEHPGRSDFAHAARNIADFERDTKRHERLQLAHGGTAQVKGDPACPKPPPVLVLYEDLVDELGPRAIYGQYPHGLIAKMLPWMRCDRHEILHVCSGALARGEGIRVDIRPDARPDVIADGRALPFADGSHAGVMLDPPYNKEYAKSLYGVEYPRPSHLLREAARVVRPGGRIAMVHYITPKPVRGTRFVKAFGLSTGFDMPMRAVTVFERDHKELSL